MNPIRIIVSAIFIDYLRPSYQSSYALPLIVIVFGMIVFVIIPAGVQQSD